MGFYCSFRAAYQNWVHIGGTKGYLRLAGFVHPESIHEPAFEVNGKNHPVKICECAAQHDESKGVAQDSQMVRNFVNRARSGKLNDDWPMWALKTQQVTDACFESAKNEGKTVRL